MSEQSRLARRCLATWSLVGRGGGTTRCCVLNLTATILATFLHITPLTHISPDPNYQLPIHLGNFNNLNAILKNLIIILCTKCMRTICSKQYNHIQLHVGTQVHSYKDAHTPTTHSHEVVGQTHHQDWRGKSALLQVGWGICFFLQHITQTYF